MNQLLVNLHWIAVVGLAIYGLNCYVLSWQFLRHRRSNLNRQRALQASGLAPTAEPPFVTVQLPVFNERFVIDRLIEACCALRYPRERLEIQVLDDSTDSTRDQIAKLVAQHRARGLSIVHLHRTERSGFKAGALAAGLDSARGEWVAIFDSDFVPDPGFLERTAPFFRDPDVGVVQCRWEHLDREFNPLTRLQALAIDGHFGVEQAARSWSGWFLNFNGTAGVWRRRAIDEAGGWAGDTLTEDLDLSYRAQLKGWRIEYLLETGVPAEIPADMTSFKSQQRRWAKGSIQTAMKLLGTVLRAPLPWTTRLQATLHLTHYLIHPLMLSVALLSVPVQWVLGHESTDNFHGMALAALLFVGTCGPSTLYILSQRALGRRVWHTLKSLPALMLVGTGIALSNSVAVFEALIGKSSEFVRTPKRRVVGREHAGGCYRLPPERLQRAEWALALWTAAGCVLHLRGGYQLFSPFLFLYALGFGWVAYSTKRESASRAQHLERPERHPMQPDPAPGLPNESRASVTS